MLYSRGSRYYQIRPQLSRIIYPDIYACPDPRANLKDILIQKPFHGRLDGICGRRHTGCDHTSAHIFNGDTIQLQYLLKHNGILRGSPLYIH